MFQRRLRILLILITAAVLVIIARLGWLQLAQGEYYAERARVNTAYKEDIDTHRGIITDRNGVQLALDEYKYDLCIVPVNFTRLEDPDAWCRVVGILLGRSADDVRTRIDEVEVNIHELARSGPEWRWKRDLVVLRRRRHPIFVGLTADEIKRLDLAADDLPHARDKKDRDVPVYTVERNLHRVYPLGTLASHLIGYVGPVNSREYNDKGYRYAFDGDTMKRFFINDEIGRGGIEARYERELRGARGMSFGIKDVRGQPVMDLPEKRVDAKPGRDVRLTIDVRIQRYAEEALDAQVRDLQADMRPSDRPVCGALVLIDPHTGDVLAAASHPRYDLNTVHADYLQLLGDRKDPHNPKPLLHRALAGAYPMGSVFKIVVAVAGLEENILSGHTEFNCSGTLFNNDHAYRCTGLHGPIEMSVGLERSCNVYFLQAGLLVGGERIGKWAGLLGLGRRTGVELTEPAGNVPVCQSSGDVLNLSIGQGRLLATPLQVARLMGCVALDGKLPDSRLSVEQRIRITRVPLHADRLATVRWGMRDVVHGGRGTARTSGRVVVRRGNIERELVYAGKTGTAQTGRADIYHAWFAGFAPFREPRVAFACVLENTHGPRGGGGAAAGPVVARFLKRILQDPETASWLEGGLE